MGWPKSKQQTARITVETKRQWKHERLMLGLGGNDGNKQICITNCSQFCQLVLDSEL
ncbi:hypothetical protein Hdeb2414_s0003g00088561 [Helianthus debilis subsp. tardiflorus]